jgi:Bacterial membrane protein YfhO
VPVPLRNGINIVELPSASTSTSGIFPETVYVKSDFDRADYYCLIGLCGLVLLLYAQLWLPGLVLIKRDAFHFFLPLKQYMIERLSAGELPQWFPYEGFGRPFIGIPMTGMFHPFTALYWFLPIPEAYRLSTLIACLLGAAGTFVLGRVVGISRTGAFLAAIAFLCSGYVASTTENVVYLYSICLLPVFLVVLDKSCTIGKQRWMAVSALVWASVFLNGDVQTGYYYGFIACLWVVLRTKQSRWRAVPQIVPVALLTALLAGVQLAPAWVVFHESDRSDATVFQEQTMRWSTHPLRLFSLAFSPIGESTDEERMARELFSGKDRSAEVPGFLTESLYIGLPLLGLALVGMWHRRDLLVFTFLAVTALVLALGKYGGLYGLLVQVVPFWSAFRYPEKFMGLMSFALALLAGGGLDVLRAGRIAPAWWGGSTLICLGLSVLLYADASPHWLVDAFHISEDLAQHVAGNTAKALLLGSVTAAGMAALTGWINIQPARRVWASVAVIALITLDLARANLPAVHTSSAEVWTFSPGLARAITDDAKVEGPGHFRVLSITDRAMQVSPDVVRALRPQELAAALRRQALGTEHNAVFHIESVHSYLPGERFIFTYVGRHASTRSLARYNVGYFIGRASRFSEEKFAGSFIAAVPDYDLSLVRNPVPLTPRAYLSKRPEVLSPSMAILSFLDREDFLRGEVDGVEGPAVPLPEPSNEGRATILDYRPETVRIAVETSHEAVLVLVDSFESGWKARIDGGNDLQIFRANGLVRAVRVPPGCFHVLFEYETPLLRIGAIMSLFGVLVTIFLIWKDRNGQRATS